VARVIIPADFGLDPFPWTFHSLNPVPSAPVRWRPTPCRASSVSRPIPRAGMAPAGRPSSPLCARQVSRSRKARRYAASSPPMPVARPTACRTAWWWRAVRRRSRPAQGGANPSRAGHGARRRPHHRGRVGGLRRRAARHDRHEPGAEDRCGRADGALPRPASTGTAWPRNCAAKASITFPRRST
jgi:hypothetical protein